MDLQKEFAEDLRRLSGMAQDLRGRLEAVQSSKQNRSKWCCSLHDPTKRSQLFSRVESWLVKV
jgi:hypothetical protein